CGGNRGHMRRVVSMGRRPKIRHWARQRLPRWRGYSAAIAGTVSGFRRPARRPEQRQPLSDNGRYLTDAQGTSSEKQKRYDRWVQPEPGERNRGSNLCPEPELRTA